MGIFDEVLAGLEDDQLDIWGYYKPYGWQKELHETKAQFRVLPNGRQSGKSEAAMAELIKRGHYEPGQYQIITPILRHGDATWRKFWKMVRPVQGKIVHRKKEEPRTVFFKNGTEINWASADRPDTIRGIGPKGYVLDEFAYNRDMEKVWAVIAPSLLTQKAWVTFLSTPSGKNNLFYKFWKRGMDPKEPNWVSWGYPPGEGPYQEIELNGKLYFPGRFQRGFCSLDNPFLADNDLAKYVEDMTEDMILQEFFSCFLDDVGRTFGNIDNNFGNVPLVSKPEKDVELVLGVDVAKREDYTVVTVMDYNGHIKKMYRWRTDWVQTKAWLKFLSEFWNAPIIMDQTGVGDPILEDLAQQGVDVSGFDIYNNKKKLSLIHRLQIGMGHGKIQFPGKEENDDEDVPPSRGAIRQAHHEFDCFSYRKTQSGLTVYEAPEGEHDDCVMSVALAWYLVYGGKVEGFSESWTPDWFST